MLSCPECGSLDTYAPQSDCLHHLCADCGCRWGAPQRQGWENRSGLLRAPLTEPGGSQGLALGTLLAVSQVAHTVGFVREALGGGWFWPAAAAHPSLPRGALMQVAIGERPSLNQVLTGPSDDPFGSLNLVGGLRRSMAKAGYCDLKEFQKVGLTVGS